MVSYNMLGHHPPMGLQFYLELFIRRKKFLWLLTATGEEIASDIIYFIVNSFTEVWFIYCEIHPLVSDDFWGINEVMPFPGMKCINDFPLLFNLPRESLLWLG